MSVVDASVIVEVVLQTSAGRRAEGRVFGRDAVIAPHILDLEVVHVVRRLNAKRGIEPRRGRIAISLLPSLPIRRFAHTPLLARIWELRNNLSAYDAAYVALAETLDAPLVTRDARLARASGHHARIELI